MTEVPEKVRDAYQELPPGWKLEKLKFFAGVRNSNVDKTVSEDEVQVRLCNYTDVYYNDRITADLPFMEGSATKAEIERFQLKRDQVIITKDSEGWDDIGIPALVTEDMPNVLCGYHLSVFEPGTELDGSFLAWLCRAEPLNAQFKLAANGVTRFGLGQYPMKNAFIALPPLDTQRRIARFLDEKTARIDGLIEKKRALLDRLAEKRQALITRAVTKGLNPDAPMKPSGIDWLGDIPAHWEVIPLKRFGQVRSGITKGKSYANEETLELPYLRVANVQDGWLDLSEIAEIEVRVGDVQRYSLEDGDILMNEGGDNDKLGRGTVWNSQISPCLHQNHVFAVRVNLLNPNWVARCTEAAYAKFHFFRRAVQSTNLASISRSVVADLPVPLLPRDEIAQILEVLGLELGQTSKQIGNIDQSVALLAEYRSALITAAVTGRITELH